MQQISEGFSLSPHLGADQPFYGLQTPDLVENGKTYISIEELAALYVREIQRIQSQGPYQVGGWSSGGVMAFEIAQQLSKRHQKVALTGTPGCQCSFYRS